VASTEATCNESVPPEAARDATASAQRATEAFDELTLEIEHIVALTALLEEIFEVGLDPPLNLQRLGPGVAAIARDIAQRVTRINASAETLLDAVHRPARDEVLHLAGALDTTQRQLRALRDDVERGARRPRAAAKKRSGR
jgi:hypothetical protein